MIRNGDLITMDLERTSRLFTFSELVPGAIYIAEPHHNSAPGWTCIKGNERYGYETKYFKKVTMTAFDKLIYEVE